MSRALRRAAGADRGSALGSGRRCRKRRRSGRWTHRLRDEEREDAGDGSAAGHAAVDDATRREGTGGSVGCQPWGASTRRDVSRSGGVRERARDVSGHALGGRGGADGDVALGHGLSRDLGDNGGTGEEGGHGAGWVEGVGVCGKVWTAVRTGIDDVSVSLFAILCDRRGRTNAPKRVVWRHFSLFRAYGICFSYGSQTLIRPSMSNLL